MLFLGPPNYYLAVVMQGNAKAIGLLKKGKVRKAIGQFNE
jgi:hypothetical protein